MPNVAFCASPKAWTGQQSRCGRAEHGEADGARAGGINKPDDDGVSTGKDAMEPGKNKGRQSQAMDRHPVPIVGSIRRPKAIPAPSGRASAIVAATVWPTAAERLSDHGGVIPGAISRTVP